MCEVPKEARPGVTGSYKLPHEFWELRATSISKR